MNRIFKRLNIRTGEGLMKRIITIQHTQSEHHINGMIGSWTNWNLTELGEKQAKIIAENLVETLNITKPIIYSSDLNRAKQTAEPLSEFLTQKIYLKKELRERNLGEAVGKSIAWVNQHKEKDESTVDDRLFPSAESKKDAWYRLQPFFKEIVADHDEGTLIIVSHGDLLSLFLSMVLDFNIEDLSHYVISGSPGSVSIIDIDEQGKRIIRRLNDRSFLKNVSK